MNPEGFSSAEYRDELAKELKSAPKEERQDVLEQAKRSPEYWQARGETIADRQENEPIDEGMGLLVHRKHLFHGSGTADIEQFDKAEESTIGLGTYFTSQADAAAGYAKRRAMRSSSDNSPIMYESVIENIRLLDLRIEENVAKFVQGFGEFLSQIQRDNADLPWYTKAAINRAIAEINSGTITPNNLRLISFNLQKYFTDYIKSIGYEGLVAFEGGEGEEVGNHDSYVIFDPAKARIIEQHQLNLD